MSKDRFPSLLWARRVLVRYALPLALVAGWLWLLAWPSFEGDFVGTGGRIMVRVTSDAGGLVVTVSQQEGETDQMRPFQAIRDFTSLNFGEGIERGALLFHPFNAENYDLVTGSGRVRLRKSTPLIRFANAHPLVALGLLAIAMTAGMLIMLENKAKTDPKMIHPMWYAFFVALCCGTALLIAAGEAQIFDYDGQPRTTIARGIVAGANFFVDVIPECRALLVILGLIVLPQWFAYVMAGLNGAARRSRFVWVAWKWVAALIAKSFISASAVCLSIAFVGAYYGWISSEPKNVAASVLAALMALGFGIGLLCAVPPTHATQANTRKTARQIHRWMRRRLRRKPGEIATRLQRERNQQVGTNVRLPLRRRIIRFLGDI